MIPHDLPTGPWIKIAADLFNLNGRDYLLIVDYYSKFVEIVCLYHTKSQDIIKAFKGVFKVHGIPKLRFSDNGPQFISREFKDFAIAWDLQHDSSCPEYPQSKDKYRQPNASLRKQRREGKIHTSHS